jgi:hypothetical protein
VTGGTVQGVLFSPPDCHRNERTKALKRILHLFTVWVIPLGLGWLTTVNLIAINVPVWVSILGGGVPVAVIGIAAGTFLTRSMESK